MAAAAGAAALQPCAQGRPLAALASRPRTAPHGRPAEPVRGARAGPQDAAGARTGSGSRLTTARLMLTMAANWNRPDTSARATSAPTATIATGPDTASAVFAKLNTICCRPARARGPAQARPAPRTRSGCQGAPGPQARAARDGVQCAAGGDVSTRRVRLRRRSHAQPRPTGGKSRSQRPAGTRGDHVEQLAELAAGHGRRLGVALG